MRAIVRALLVYLVRLPRRMADGWMTFWFRPADAATLAMLRIGVGLVMLVIYTLLTPHILSFIGPEAYIDDGAMVLLQTPEPDGAGYSQPTFSLWYVVRNPTVIRIFHYYFLAVIFCFTIGFFSRTSNLLIWLMHLSYVHRGEIFWYGVDAMLSILLLCLLLGPTGRAFSVDRWLQRKWQKNGTSDSFDQPAWTANFSIRMVQLHWCLVYLSSGLSKLQGESWWDGSAVLQTFMLNDMSDVDFRWIGTFSDTTISLFSTAGVFLTLAYEISFTFLIWNPTLRPPLLTCAVLLHGGVAIVMGLPAFSALMVIGCLAFVPPERFRWIVCALRGDNPPTTTEQP